MRPTSSIALLACSILTACGGGAPIAGSVVTSGGATVGNDAYATVLWLAGSEGSPGYLYAFGNGPVAPDRFSVSLPGPLPQEAMISGAYGLGMIVGLYTAETLPRERRLEGKVQDQLDQSSLPAIADGHVMVYVTAGFKAQLKASSEPSAMNSPLLKFPDGHSCGKLVPTGQSLSGRPVNTIEPADCSEVVLEVRPSAQVPLFDLD